MQKTAVYGAKSIALGVYEAIRSLYPEVTCIGFIVTSKEGNPALLAGKRVWELDELKEEFAEEDRTALKVLIATPENLHQVIADSFKENGFDNYICIDSYKEAALMEKYYTGKGMFPSLHLPDCGTQESRLHVFQVKSWKDKPLRKQYQTPYWVEPLQAGADLSKEIIAPWRDNEGINISGKNVNYSELTALYWLWKNRLLPEETYINRKNDNAEYYGLFHYRRVLDITEKDLLRIKSNDVDVILPFPMLCEPDIKEHHTRYISESDWQAMLRALEELQPDYAKTYEAVFSQRYFYNYNMIIAKKGILNDYCGWLFPVLERTEELSSPRGWQRADRYIGYLAENLMTLYFMYHREDFHIAHTGRLMLI